MKKDEIGMESIKESEIRSLWGLDPEEAAGPLGYLAGRAVQHLFQAPLSPSPAEKIENAIRDLERLQSLEKKGVELRDSDREPSAVSLTEDAKSRVKAAFSRVTAESPRVTQDLIAAITRLASLGLTQKDAAEAKQLCRRIIRFVAPLRVPFAERPLEVPAAIEHLWAAFPAPFNTIFELFLRSPFFRDMPTDFRKGLRLFRVADTAAWSDWTDAAERAFNEREAFFSGIARGARCSTVTEKGETMSPFDLYLDAIGPQAKDPAAAAEKVFSAMADVYFSIRNDPDYVNWNPRLEGALEKCEAAGALLREAWEGHIEKNPMPADTPTAEDSDPLSPAARAYSLALTDAGIDRLPEFFDYASGKFIRSILSLPLSGSPARETRAILFGLRQMIGSIEWHMKDYPIRRGWQEYTGRIPRLFCSSGNEALEGIEKPLLKAIEKGASSRLFTRLRGALQPQTDFPAEVTEKTFEVIRELMILGKQTHRSDWSEPPKASLERIRKEVLFIHQAFEHAVCEDDKEIENPTDITAELWKSRPGIPDFNRESAKELKEDHPERWADAFPGISIEDLLFTLDRATGNVIRCLSRVPYLADPREELEQAKEDLARLERSKLRLSGVIPPVASEEHQALEAALKTLSETLEAERQSLAFEVFADSMKLKTRSPNSVAAQILRAIIFLIKAAQMPTDEKTEKQKAVFSEQAHKSFYDVYWRWCSNSRTPDSLKWIHSVIDLTQEGILERFPNGRIPYKAIYRHAGPMPMPISSYFPRSKRVTVGDAALKMVRTSIDGPWYIKLSDFEFFLSGAEGSGNPGFHLRADTHLKNGDILCVMGTMFLRLRGAVRYLEDLSDHPANPDPKEAAEFQTWAHETIRVLSTADPENQPESESQKDPE